MEEGRAGARDKELCRERHPVPRAPGVRGVRPGFVAQRRVGSAHPDVGPRDAALVRSG